MKMARQAILLITAMLLLLFSNSSFAASKKIEKKESAEEWYAYRFSFKDGYRTPFTTKCRKSDYSPATAIEKFEQYGIEYNIVEQASHGGKPIIVDVQRFNSMASSSGVLIERFLKGERLCNMIREKDLSGELDRERVERYR